MKKILIIGAGFLQDFVIKKANDLGYVTLVVDGNPDAIGFKSATKYKVINIIDKEACLKYAMEERIDGVLTAATDYGVLTAAYIAQEMNLSGISYEVAKLIKNKYLVRKRLNEYSIDDTDQFYEVGFDCEIENIKEKLEYPVMVKPCDGSGSRGARRVDVPESLHEACTNAINLSVTHRAEIEKFIEGREYGVESLVVNGEVNVLAIMKKWMTNPPYYAELGHAIPSGLDEKLEEKVINCVKKAIKVLGITSGSVNMDILISNRSKIHIIDIGARMGGNMIGCCIIPYGTGYKYMENMIRIAVSDNIDTKVYGSEAVVTRILAFQQEGVVKKVPDFKVLEIKNNVEIYHHVNVGTIINKYNTNLDGLGYIVARRSSVKDAEIVADKVLKEIEDELFK